LETSNPQSELTDDTHIYRQLRLRVVALEMGDSKNLPTHIYRDMGVYM
jgi:hypothetical protein